MERARERWEERTQDRKALRAQTHREALEFVARGEVAAKKLAQSPDWHFFQQIVQGEIESTRDAIAKEVDRVSVLPATVDVLLQHRVVLSALRARIEALEQVQNLPRLIEAKGAEAREALHGLR